MGLLKFIRGMHVRQELSMRAISVARVCRALPWRNT